MSPIGRVFIVLNLLLAGMFVGFSGTYLQKQSNYKQQFEAEQKAHADSKSAWEIEKNRLESERTNFELAATSNQTENGALKNQLASAQDEVKRLTQANNSFAADVKSLVSAAEANKTATEAAFNKAEEAYKMAIADQKTKDEAVRLKDTTLEENRSLKNTIAALNETVTNKDLKIADLMKERSENQLLLAVATEKGFVPSMAAPNLSGTVTHASGKLCTIAVTDNPGGVDIADQIAKNKFRIAIYDASGYKGEAVATEYNEAQKAILCNVILVNKGSISEGDKASTAAGF
ncbi:MAG: hypothetical protein H6838_05805 [Planctomycetes bacterium]|nr:hypothetical protein [Planctomycetota bacterium]